MAALFARSVSSKGLKIPPDMSNKPREDEQIELNHSRVVLLRSLLFRRKARFALPLRPQHHLKSSIFPDLNITYSRHQSVLSVLNMWLLKTTTYELVSVLSHDLPPYAILSHTRGAPEDEILFDDMKAGVDNVQYRPSFIKSYTLANRVWMMVWDIVGWTRAAIITSYA